MGGEGRQQAGHHVHVDHAGFVYHHQIRVQGIVGVMTEVPRIWPGAQQTVQGGHVGGNAVANRIRYRQGGDLVANGFGESCGGFAGGGGETNAQALMVFHGQALQQAQQFYHCGGLAGPRPAGNDADSNAAGQRAGHLLPVGAVTTVREERLQRAMQLLCRQSGRRGQPCCNGVGNRPFL